MKSYPSIQSSLGMQYRDIGHAIVFDKLDGSNLRVEWTKKTGWNKWGTRNRLFDSTDEIFAPAIKVFEDGMLEKLTKICIDNRWERVIAFMEFWGENSFAGLHEPEDEKFLTLIDVNVHKKGIIGPREFIKTFKSVDIPNVVCECNWTRGFVDRVRGGEIEGITFEGVVGKSGEGHKLLMAKAKTQAWVDKVKSRYSPEDAEKIINS